MKTIIAPTDFSDVSLNAVNYAADMACVIGTNLTLIHVCPIPVSFSEVASPASMVEELMADAEAKIRLLREKITTRTGNRLIINIAVKQGNVITEIDEYSHIVDPYAVVMGTEGDRAFERFLFGGKTITAMRQLSWPLIVIPPQAKFTTIRKIGLACDFRKVVETIPTKEITSLVKEFHSELHVLHVSAESGTSFDPETAEELRWVRDMLRELKPIYHFIHNRDIEKSINEFAEKNDFDLLIIIPKKHDLVSKVFQHSHSKRLVLQTHVPILAIHE